jgi:hypothetical protein
MYDRTRVRGASRSGLRHWTRSVYYKGEITMKTKQVLSKKQKRAAKRLFKRKPHTTRAFTSLDYKNLPNEKN